MRKVREVLRLHFECGCRHRQIAAACSVSPATVCDYLSRAEQAGLGWEQTRALSDAEVEARLFKQLGRNEPATRAAIDFAWVHGELPRIGVTLQLLWGEYQAAAQAAGARPYQYSQFCELYSGWRDQRRLSMRQVHRPGEKLFVDYSGKRPRIYDPETGEVREVELFVAVLGASNYTFAEVTFTQRVPDFIASSVRALEYFGAVPSSYVSDQLKSAVKKAQRWILARLRNRTFFSLTELNNAVAELVEELNARNFQKLPGTRREAFETLDRPSMKPLPPLRFELRQRKGTRANIDYHVDFDDRFYSVPFGLRQKPIEVRATAPRRPSSSASTTTCASRPTAAATRARAPPSPIPSTARSRTRTTATGRQSACSRGH